MTMLLHKSDIVTASYDSICILMSQLEIYISLLLVQNQLRDSRSVNRGGGELLEDAGIFTLSLVLRAFLDKIKGLRAV